MILGCSVFCSCLERVSHSFFWRVNMLKLVRITFFLVLVFAAIAFGNFPTYIELNVGETVQAGDYPQITLISKKVTFYDSTFSRIGAAEVELRVGDEIVTVPVGYENADVIVNNVRIGTEVISDYESDFINKRFHLEKDARIRILKANEPLMPAGSHVHPLYTPWNSGFRTQGWLTVCVNVDILEGIAENKRNRYHDGWDFGVWEGKLVRSVCRGIIVSPDDYPEFIEKSLLYNKNDAPIGPNCFLVKHPEQPVLYYYTHMSGLARDFKRGEIIEKGEPLGYASARGSSGGWFHLHFSIIHLEKKVHVNPFPFLKEWYAESLPHYQDFLTDFDVYYNPDNLMDRTQFEKDVVLGKIKSSHKFKNSLPGIVHVREAVAEAPFSGLNHVVFNQCAILKGTFECENDMPGELWFGHTGIARLYLNGNLVYEGENKNPYHRKKQPFQWDSQMKQVEFNEGMNEVIIAIEQTNPFWSFSIRPRTRLGIPMNR
ncbi:peptidoglycan DD-metalloendopeptidase family protein [candidate division KSB1 bacterium]|nr:peptidoglycan DD-metalloendopeptidase family protein [candidate division KSB1 bacterium]